MAKKWHQGKLIKMKDESPTTRRFWIEVEAEESPFAFRPGQFITLDLPIGETRLDRWRSYSIANAPDDTNILELCIVKLKEGRASSYFFDAIEIGQKFRFKGPGGIFTLPQKTTKELVFICTGTGIAPFRSMIHDLINKGETLPIIHLIFGTRKMQGILYREELEQLAQNHPSFQYSIALSRELPKVAANIHTGYVHQIYEQTYKTAREDLTFYLCGWSNMVDEAQKNLVDKMGFDKKQVIVELYG